MMTKKYITLTLITMTLVITKANESFQISMNKPLPVSIKTSKIITSNLLDKFNKLRNTDNAKLVEIVEKAGTKVSGIVSWYSDKFHGKKTSSGESYDKKDLTAAHKSLPFGTKVKVTNVRNGKSVVVKINDRGPHTKSRLLDLSRAAFSSIGSIDSGTLKVDMEVVN